MNSSLCFAENTLDAYLKQNPQKRPVCHAPVAFSSIESMEQYMGTFVGLRVDAFVVHSVRLEQYLKYAWYMDVFLQCLKTGNMDLHLIGRVYVDARSPDRLVVFTPDAPHRDFVMEMKVYKAQYARLCTAILQQQLRHVILCSSLIGRVRRHRLFDRNVLISVLAGYLKIFMRKAA
jgi:hypothetical protein